MTVNLKAIFSEYGIQRIRGMAGSGKTIVIARKAAQLHMENPLWNIIVTYSTRSQKHQLEKLIKNYYMKITDGQTPNFNNLRIMHSWGSANANGLYYEICLTNNVAPLTYGMARSLYKKSNIFDKTCERFLNECPEPNKVYDCIIIDEAQDFKSNFFKMCLKTLKEERLIYAYDELQNLGGESMDPPDKLFGKKEIIDTPLKVCYRNQKNVITTDHALGLGLYSKSGLLQIPSENSVWEAIGYQSNHKIENGQDVLLYRPDEYSPNLINIDKEEVINCDMCIDVDDQSIKALNLINTLIQKDKLLATDIIVIDMDTINAEENYKKFLDYSNQKNIKIHYAGGTSKEEFFRENSIVYSTIFRAKGNESFYVIILNAQKLYNSIADISERNSIFTAITRSKGWVRLFGVGEGMSELITEYENIKNNNFMLNFTPYPSLEEMKKLRKYNMELTKSDENSLNSTKEMIKKLLNDSKKDPLIIAKDIFNVQSKEELRSLLFGNEEEE